MKRALLVASGVMAISTTASAGGYVGLAVGTRPGVNDELANSVANPQGRSFRGLGGIRFGNVSIEGALNGFGAVTAQDGERNIYQLSAAAKLSLPLGDGFEAFGRAGLEHAWLDLGDDRYNLSGNGFLVGAGFEYRFNLGVANASVFVDYNIHSATLKDQRDEIEATTGAWGLGATVGF